MDLPGFDLEQQERLPEMALGNIRAYLTSGVIDQIANGTLMHSRAHQTAVVPLSKRQHGC